MNVSEQGLEFIAKWEGFREKAYQDVAGVWTIGYGTTRYQNGQVVRKGDVISVEEAWILFKIQVEEHASSIPLYVGKGLTQSQFDALASFQYNLGKHVLSKNITLRNAIINKDLKTIEQQMLLYVNAGGKRITGLYNRRVEEVAMYKKVAKNTHFYLDIKTGGFPTKEGAINYLEGLKKNGLYVEKFTITER